jgi:hypothetical protein
MPEALAGYGVTEIADHIAGQLRELPQKPILIGHSLTIDIGWKELADYSLSWLQGKGL